MQQGPILKGSGIRQEQYISLPDELYTVYYIYVLEWVFFCNINHCNDSAPCWDLDWIIKSYLILSYIYMCIYLFSCPSVPAPQLLIFHREYLV